MLDFYASEPHYIDHLGPVWQAVNPRVRGRFVVPPQLTPYARLAGLTATPGRPAGAGPLVVAGYTDERRATRRPVALLEHGAGQSYTGVPAGWGSGPNPDRPAVRLYLAPSERAAARARATIPGAEAVAVGCPKLDPWHAPGSARPRETSRGPVVAVTFHWPCQALPESQWALPHYTRHLPALVSAVRAAGGEVLGHGHPRAASHLRALWRRLGVEWVPRLASVLNRADLLVADNTSALFEFASTGRPVVVLNAPWYRRDIHHGLRFWSCADVGVQVDRGRDLLDAVEVALVDLPDVAARRAEVVAEVYARADGTAAAAAAAALEGALESGRLTPLVRAGVG